MRIGISSDAAPGASAAELVEACEQRGLTTLELRLGIELGDMPDTHVTLAGLLTDDLTDVHAHVARSVETGAPVIVGSRADIHARLMHVRRIERHGGSALLLVRGPADEWLDTVALSRVRFVWQVDDSCDDAAGDAARILRTAHPAGVRLVGGGPEATMLEGRGVGSVMSQLALAAFDGPVILTPSSPRFRLAWASWLGRRGGWGCGSAGNAAPLPLSTIAHITEVA